MKNILKIVGIIMLVIISMPVVGALITQVTIWATVAPWALVSINPIVIGICVVIPALFGWAVYLQDSNEGVA